MNKKIGPSVTAALTAIAAFDSAHEEHSNESTVQGIEPPSSPHVGEEPVIEEIRAPEGYTMIVTKPVTDTLRIAIDEQANVQALTTTAAEAPKSTR